MAIARTQAYRDNGLHVDLAANGDGRRSYLTFGSAQRLSPTGFSAVPVNPRAGIYR
jgi:hypothetical protein